MRALDQTSVTPVTSADTAATRGASNAVSALTVVPRDIVPPKEMTPLKDIPKETSLSSRPQPYTPQKLTPKKSTPLLLTSSPAHTDSTLAITDSPSMQQVTDAMESIGADEGLRRRHGKILVCRSVLVIY